MDELQRDSVKYSLASPTIGNALFKVNLSPTDSDIVQVMAYPHVLALKSRVHQLEPHEQSLADLVSRYERDDVLLLGNTPAIDGFLLKQNTLIQLKRAGVGREAPPGTFIQAFLTAWQKAHTWTGISLYISAPNITTEFAQRRWDTVGTDPKLEKHHLNGQISRVTVFCANGPTRLPLRLPTGSGSRG
jgi:hypothetical protein